MAKCPTCGGPDGVLLLFNIAPCNRCDILEKKKYLPVTETTEFASKQSAKKYKTLISNDGRIPRTLSVFDNPIHYYNGFTNEGDRDNADKLFRNAIKKGDLKCSYDAITNLYQFDSSDSFIGIFYPPLVLESTGQIQNYQLTKRFPYTLWIVRI